jgi:hypothetical protein
LTTRAKHEQGSGRVELLEHAVNVLQRSANLGESGQTPVPMRLFLLARSQSELGRHETAATTYANIAAMEQAVVSRHYMQYLSICEVTSKDGPEYREAIERALVDSSGRGGGDDYEATLRHYLGLSYRRAQQYAKSTEILGAIIGKGGDASLDAYNTFLVAMNYKDSGDAGKARGLLNAIQKQYAGTGSARMAEEELKEMDTLRGGQWVWIALFAIAALVTMVVGLVTWRLLKSGLLWGSELHWA